MSPDLKENKAFWEQLNPTVSAKLVKCFLSLALMPVGVESCPMSKSGLSFFFYIIVWAQTWRVTFFGALREQEDKESLNLDLHLGKASPPTSGSSGLSTALCSCRVTFYHFDWDETVKRFPPWRWMKHVTTPLPNQPSLVSHSDLHNTLLVYFKFLSMHAIFIFSPVLEGQSV